MAEKRFIRNFEKFKGIDLRSSDLTRPINFSKVQDNVELDRIFALQGRRGGKLLAERENILQIHDYTYFNPDTGETETQVIGLGDRLYVLTEADFTISYTGGSSDWGYSFLVNESTNVFEFILYDDTTAVLTVDCGTGLESSPYLLSTLQTAINALSDFSATFTWGTPPAAALALKTRQNLGVAGSDAIPYFYWADQYTAVDNPLGDWYDARDDADWIPATIETINNVVKIATPYTYPHIYDGQNVYREGLREPLAYTLPEFGENTLSVTPSGSGSMTGTYKYWAQWVHVDDKGNETRSVMSEAETASPSSSASVTVSYAKHELGETCFSWGANAATSSLSYTAVRNYGETSITKFPKVGDKIWIFDRTGGANVYVKRTISAITRTGIGTGTVTITGGTVTTNSGDYARVVYEGFIADKGGKVNGNQNGVTTIAVDAGHNIDPGDKVFLGTEGTKTVTGITVNSITVDEAVSVIDNDFISVGLRLDIYRSVDTGSTPYLLTSVPNPIVEDGSFWVNYTDTKADSELGAEYLWPSKDANLLRAKPSIVTEHQGLTIYAGDRTQPNTVWYEDLETPGGFPIATNSIDVSSSESGPITAVRTDDINQLAIFKARSYFNLVADFTLAEPEISITRVTDGDYGVTSQNSLKKVKDFLLGIGEMGPLAVKNGNIDTELGKQLASDFLLVPSSTSAQLKFSHAMAVNDFREQKYIVYIPALTVSSNTYPNSNSKCYVFDYDNLVWSTRTLQDDQNYAAGLCMSDGNLYYASKYNISGTTYSTVFKRHYNVTDELKYDFADNTLAITQDFWPQWDDSQVPSIDKEFYHFKLWSIISNSDYFVPFTARLRTYANWDTSTAIEDLNLTISSATDFEALTKLLASKYRSMLFRLTVSTIHTRLHLTGYEYVVGDDFIPEEPRE